MNFQSLLSLQLTHTYYADGRCPDFDIVPYPETQIWLLNHRAILRTKSSGLSLLISVMQENVPLISLDKTITLQFALYLRNPEFALYTDLSTYKNRIYTNVSGKSLLLPRERTESDSETGALRPNPFAQVELIHKGGLAAKVIDYEIAFKAKALRWAYMLVTETNNTNFAVTGGDTTFNIYDYHIDNPARMSIDAVASELTERNIGKRIICLTSKLPLACQQTVRKSIKLEKNQKPVIKNLPNPKPNNVVIMDGEPVLYEVVKFSSEPVTE